MNDPSLEGEQIPSASQPKRTLVLAGNRRFKLPWLDGNVISGPTPDTSDVENDLPGHFPHQDDQTGDAAEGSSTKSTANLTRFPAPSAVSLPQSNRARSRQHTRSWSSPLAHADTSMWDPTMPGGWPLVNGQLQYTPSSYSSQPPSESGLPHHLSRRDPHSYEDLVEENSAYPPRPPTWPLVPLSDTEFPPRMSSLTFREPDRQDSTLLRSRSAYELSRGSSLSSIGRFNDGTISRKPTVRASSMQARLDRAATAQLRSPNVSPKSSAPPRLAPATTSPVAVNNEQLSLQRAVTGLHDLMQEALTVATEAAQANQTDEVAQILSEATLALRSANTIQGRMPKPLQLNDPELGRRSSTDDYPSDSDGYVESETSSIDGSHETVPTSYTKSRSALSMRPEVASFKPADDRVVTSDVPNSGVAGSESYYPRNARKVSVNPPYRENGKRPAAQRATLDSARLDVHRMSSSDDRSIGRTPPAMYPQQSADSVATDWAYVKRVPGRRELRDTTAGRKSMASSVEQPAVVVAPAPIRVPTQDQSSFLSRSSPTYLRGTSEPSGATALDLPEIPRRRTTRQVPEPSTQDMRAPPPSPRPFNDREYQPISHRQAPEHHGPHLGHLFESSYYKLPDKERDVHQGPETRYGLSTAVISPNLSLRHPRRNHISLAENQTYRMHRYRRQPIAREWSTKRKRLTAVIACMNTALVGLIAGIYVRSSILEASRLNY